MENIKQLKKKLDYHYKAFNRETIYPDPLCFPHQFKNSPDIEISAFISSVFAYGNVKQIMKILEEIHSIMGASPYEFVIEYKTNMFSELVHRFFTGDDIHQLFMGLSRIYKEYGSLNYLFLLYHFSNEKNLKDSISFFCRNLTNAVAGKKISHGIKFMFPDPEKGSACKRMNLFLRWMVRKDELDFGLWSDIKPEKLVIPVDTHIAKISEELGLTESKNVSWKMAEEITENLKQFNKEDPVKYDFALCHIGMRKLEF